MFERVVVSGGPHERGVQYGAAARERVARSIAAYRAVFADVAGWSWDEVRAHAEHYRDAIARFEPAYLEEIAGIAEGAGVDEQDVLSINVRTEVMFAAKARAAEATMRLPSECTSWALLPERAADERLLVGQTWDWLRHSVETTIVLEVHQDEGPDFVTVVEAGLLAKAGLNSAGISLCANALVCDADKGEPGVPFHILLRAIFDSETVSDALVALTRERRSSSGNYLIADQDGLAVNVEAAPGDYSRVYLTYPENGLILHANHFVSEQFDGRDVAVQAMPDSPFRLQRLRQLVERVPERLDRGFFERAMADHATFPLGICAHPDPRVPRVQQYETVAALIMDPDARCMWVAAGRPCSTPFELLDLSDALNKPSPVRAMEGS
jgi:isopenicillin-N N-acyltransferase-like protein